MNVVFDTSVIVAAVVSAHPLHAWAREQLEDALTGRVTGFVSVRTLAESYALLTRLPTRPRLRPRQVRHLVEENLRDLSVIPMRARDWRAALARTAEQGLGAEAIDDALVIEGALGAGADVLLTLEPPRFSRLGPDAGALVDHTSSPRAD